MTQSNSARLIAILQVDKLRRVQCQTQGCAHGVYKAIHVVEEDGAFTVMGSTCFAKRFGKSNALGPARYGGGGGRSLTEAERKLLLENTAALIDSLEREQQVYEEAAREKLKHLRTAFEERKEHAIPSLRDCKPHNFGIPWDWAKPMSSIAYFQMTDGTAWVRVQHQSGFHLLMPWPFFEGWDEAFPASVGTPEPDFGGLKVSNIVETVSYLKNRARLYQVGIWREIFGGKRG